MAFFRNFSDETVSHNALEDKTQGQGIHGFRASGGTKEVDLNSTDREFDINMDPQYESDGGRNNAGSLPSTAASAHDDDVPPSTLQPSGGRSSGAAQWGSTFWKDCQPMHREDGHDSKSGSDSDNAEGSGDNSPDGRGDRLDSEDDDGQKALGKDRRGYNDVPAEEMLSDEYYEQDGEEQSDSMHYSGFNRAVGSSSRPQSTQNAGNSRLSRNSRAVIDDEDENNDDGDYEDEDDGDGNIFNSLCFVFSLSNC